MSPNVVVAFARSRRLDRAVGFAHTVTHVSSAAAVVLFDRKPCVYRQGDAGDVSARPAA